jgi:glycerol uptake facilitator protein
VVRPTVIPQEHRSAPRNDLLTGSPVAERVTQRGVAHASESHPMKFSAAQEFTAELLGTMVLILFGCGVVAMATIFPASLTTPIPGEVVKGGYTNITFAWGLAVVMGIYVSGTISGAHLNPAVTLALAATKRFPWSKVGHYLAGQLIGAFAGAALVFAVYHAQWIQFDPQLEKTAGVFSTFPAVPGFFPGFLDQVVGTALLMGLILAIGDKLNNPMGAPYAPLSVGLLVVAIGMSFGGMHGYAINPARDFGPRLFSVVAGFKNNGLTDSTVWVVPIVGPIVGALLGAWIYDFAIGKALAQAHATHGTVQGMDPSHRDS